MNNDIINDDSKLEIVNLTSHIHETIRIIQDGKNTTENKNMESLPLKKHSIGIP